jgi:pimeloyl-ACP methyl ester carboxylesterase
LDFLVVQGDPPIGPIAATGLPLTTLGKLPGVRLVDSPAAAAAAFAAGATIVVYDGEAMLATAFADLAAARPAAVDPAVADRVPLVLLSGMLGDEHLWDDVSALLADAVKPWPARIDLDDSVPEMAASVLAVAPPRFALAGHSLGAIVALEIARRAPERVDRLALLNASARGASAEQLAAWSSARNRTEQGHFADVAAELGLAALAPDRRDAELVARNTAMARTVGADGFLRQLAAQAARPESRPDLTRITVPVLVISGAVDTICPSELQRELVELCPQAELATIEGCGHMAPLEDPAAVAELLRAWLAQ